MTTNDEQLAARILVETISHGRLSLGCLAKQLEGEPAELVTHLAPLVVSGALELCTASDDPQLAIAPGPPEAVARLSQFDNTGTIHSWLALCSARSGEGVQKLRSWEELQRIATRYNQRARRAVIVLASCGGTNGQEWRDFILGSCREMAFQGAEVIAVVPHFLPDRPSGQELATALCEAGAGLRIASRVDASLVLWRGLAAVHLPSNGNNLLLQLDDVEDLEPVTDAWVECATLEQRVTPAVVVRLLATGLTDAGAARKLGISERQFRRYVSVMMKKLEASSRFQAGVEAARCMDW